MEERYKLYNGDCLEIMDKLIEKGIKVDMVLTDLPYGTTQNKWDSIIPFDEMWKRLNMLSKRNTCIALFSQTPFDKELGHSNIKELRYEWIWEKSCGTGFLNAKKMPLKKHENILIFYRKLPTYNPQGLIYKPKIQKRGGSSFGKTYGQASTQNFSEYTNYPVDIIKFNHDKEKFHPTQKPVALLEYLIKTYTNENELVLDFTAGSFSTGVACVNTNRKFIGIELDSEYFKIGKKRMIEADSRNESAS